MECWKWWKVTLVNWGMCWGRELKFLPVCQVCGVLPFKIAISLHSIYLNKSENILRAWHLKDKKMRKEKNDLKIMD